VTHISFVQGRLVNKGSLLDL